MFIEISLWGFEWWTPGNNTGLCISFNIIYHHMVIYFINMWRELEIIQKCSNLYFMNIQLVCNVSKKKKSFYFHINKWCLHPLWFAEQRWAPSPPPYKYSAESLSAWTGACRRWAKRQSGLHLQMTCRGICICSEINFKSKPPKTATGLYRIKNCMPEHRNMLGYAFHTVD